ncbi:hypothetical protein C7B77_20565 [Chamaesiphon polymorphus CCALA 037]|uniref:Uncharacterized protein n=1 Tax=Chamaesiphon polymorphus CCALA 037 TaxID=2107692 RepID=A0A2T1G582_9CYAN|nr:hypothetical protein C7B77_20565 [Chamaesiphon polymorphus CCALA 037]
MIPGNRTFSTPLPAPRHPLYFFILELRNATLARQSLRIESRFRFVEISAGSVSIDKIPLVSIYD